MKNCTQCKAEIHKDAKKCQHCGSVQGWTFCAKSCLVFICIIAVFYFIGSVLSSFKDSSKVAENVGCDVANVPMEYTIIEEKYRKSDVNGINIKECYILIRKQSPLVEELKAFATALGVNNDNIEFRIFNDERAYEIYFNKYQSVIASGGKDSDISQRDWDIVDKHWIANYLKAYARLRHNYLLLQSNIYEERGNGNEIQIVN